MTEFIADGKFMALRAEAQETNMLLREILKALQSSGAQAEPLVPKTGPKTAIKTPAIPKEAVGKATVETVETVDTGKTEQWGNAPKGYDAPKDKTEPVQMATRAPSPQDEQGAQPPAVPRRGQVETGSRGR